MNQHCNTANPNINKATEMLVQYDSISVKKFINACKSDTRAPEINRLLRERNTAYRTARQFQRDGEITNEAYIAKILNL